MDSGLQQEDKCKTESKSHTSNSGDHVPCGCEDESDEMTNFKMLKCRSKILNHYKEKVVKKLLFLEM